MSVVDASVLVALCDGTDDHHAKAIELLRDVQITVTNGTIDEVARSVRRKANLSGQDGNQAGRAAVRTILALGLRQGQPIGLPEIEPIFARHGHLSWIDAWNIALAQATGEPLLTFDVRMRKAAARELRDSPQTS